MRVSLEHPDFSLRSGSQDPLLPQEKSQPIPPSFQFRVRRKHLFLVAAASLVGLSYLAWNNQTPTPLSTVPESALPSHNIDLVPPPPQEDADPYAPEHWLLGPPTQSFRDNLRSDQRYITSWTSAGWTNDVMTYANLIYLAILTERIPVIPPFIPSHIGSHVPPIPFGEVFDVPRISKALDRPILEFGQVKDPNSTVLDDIGCWNIWEAVQDRDHNPRHSPHLNLLKLDISYTKAPTWIKAAPQFENDPHASFWGLASLSYPDLRTMGMSPPVESPEHKVLLPPDEQMLCYDYLYYVCAFTPFDFAYDFSPVWRFVGRYMYFTPRLMAIADEYARRAMGIVGSEPTPPFISIHIRHADFGTYCQDRPKEECFASMPVIARRVREAQDELWEKKGIQANHVIVTSDERDEAWWKEVADQGWVAPDHSRTKELYGEWYPVLIDAVIQSSGAGFVGTDGSTMSMIARRRTESWREGATRTVKWGYPGADDH